MKTIRLFFLLCLLWTPVLLRAQEDTTQNDRHYPKHEIDSAMAFSPDFMPVFYDVIEPHWIRPLYLKPVDTSMAQIHQYDPLFKNYNLCQDLGIPGQAHQFMNFDFERELGFSMITLPYPLLWKTQRDVKFYDVQTSFTNLSFTYGISTMYEFDATHTQKFKGVTAAFDMHAYSNEGYFLNQQARNININALINYEEPAGVYGFTVSYIFNRLKDQDNGGLRDTSLFAHAAADALTGYPVKSEYGRSKIRTHDLLFQQYVNIRDKKKRYYGTITHSFQYKHLSTDYFDNNFDSTFYQKNFYYSTDTTFDTLRCYSIINSLQWSNYKPMDTLPSKKYFLRAALGLMHEYVNSKWPYYVDNTFTLFGRLHVRLFGVMDLYGRMAYSFGGYNNNDVVAAVGVQWMIQKKWDHRLGGDISFYRNSPDYIYDSYFGNHNLWLQNDWPKQNTLKFNVFWTMMKYKVEFNYFMLHNIVRLNSDFQLFLTEKYANVVQVHLFAPIRVKGFGMDINAYLQYSSSEAVNVPLFAFKASPYYIFNILRGKLKIQIGMDLMYNTLYYADGYDPVMHQFYCQRDMKVGNYPYWDVNLSFRIKRITFFFRAGHVLSGVIGQNYYLTPDYPAMGRSFQLGINWRFYD
ncbi:MAG: hypothetical protein J6X16_08850 [Bacteroidales bacterium]|nr:hypothetical protein [Bacteroidales bacterium]